MSLFPDRYPAKPTPVVRRMSCCDADVPTDEPWSTIHVLAHSRVPFSDHRVVEMTGVGLAKVRAVLQETEKQGWIGPLIPEAYMTKPPDLWVGHLPKRR